MKTHIVTRSLTLMLVALLVALLSVPLALLNAQEPPESTKAALAAWEALVIGNYQTAIERAERCVAEYSKAATDAQKKLKDAPLPPTGAVKQTETKAILAEATLNDATLCQFTHAEALAKLLQFVESRAVYTAVLAFPHARVVDSVGWVWSPAALAQERLDTMHAVMAQEGWDKLGFGEFETAIEVADQCLEVFLPLALAEQAELKRKRVPLPPTGGASSEETEKIAARPMLNDTGACLWIRASAFQQAGKKKEAIAAYRDVQKLPYARLWDVRGWFWSPAAVSVEEIAKLR